MGSWIWIKFATPRYIQRNKKQIKIELNIEGKRFTRSCDLINIYFFFFFFFWIGVDQLMQGYIFKNFTPPSTENCHSLIWIWTHHSTKKKIKEGCEDFCENFSAYRGLLIMTRAISSLYDLTINTIFHIFSHNLSLSWHYILPYSNMVSSCDLSFLIWY